MEKLLKAYLKAQHPNSEVVYDSHYTNGHICFVKWHYSGGEFYGQEDQINVWEMLEFLFAK